MNISVFSYGGIMNFDKASYQKLVSNRAKRTNGLKNCTLAFLVGGGICALGELIYAFFFRLLLLPDRESSLYASCVLIFLSALFTGLGVFDDLAKHAGAGTFLPITGFANAIVSPAIDSRAEGYILGVGAKVFTVAGPVLLYGTVAGTLWGLIYYFFGGS